MSLATARRTTTPIASITTTAAATTTNNNKITTTVTPLPPLVTHTSVPAVLWQPVPAKRGSQPRLLSKVTMKCLLLILAFVAALLPSARGLSCLPCREVTCELPAAVTRCTWGLVLDMCGCCYVCGKGPGETCGGQWAWHGRCGHTLDCLKPHEVTGANRDRERVMGGNVLALLNMEEPARCYRQRDSVADSISTFFSWFSSLFRNGPRDD